jgi:hypothetical protein
VARVGWGYDVEGEEATIFNTMRAGDDSRKGNYEGEGLLSMVMAR